MESETAILCESLVDTITAVRVLTDEILQDCAISVSPPSVKKSNTNTVSPAALAQASITNVLSTPKSAPEDASEKSRRTIKMLRATLSYIMKKENKKRRK